MLDRGRSRPPARASGKGTVARLIKPWGLPARSRGIRRAGSDATSAPNADPTACRFILCAALGLVSGNGPGRAGPGCVCKLVAGDPGGGGPPACPGGGTWGLLPGMRRKGPKAESDDRRLGEVARAGTQAFSRGCELVKSICAGHQSTPTRAAPSAAERRNRSRSCGRGMRETCEKPRAPAP